MNENAKNLVSTEEKNDSQIRKFWSKVVKFLKWFKEEFIKFPLFILFHPLKGWDEFKREKRGKMSVAIWFVIFVIFLSIMEYQYSGFIVKQVEVTDLKMLAEIAYIIAPVVLVTVANWSITTLFDGKGKMKEIFMMICYSLQPFIVINFLYDLLSNFLTTDEAQFLTLIKIVAITLLCLMAFMGFVVIHEYGIFKTIGSILLTALALCIIVFIALLIFDLSQQIYGFIYSIYKEIATRFL